MQVKLQCNCAIQFASNNCAEGFIWNEAELPVCGRDICDAVRSFCWNSSVLRVSVAFTCYQRAECGDAIGFIGFLFIRNSLSSGGTIFEGCNASASASAQVETVSDEQTRSPLTFSGTISLLIFSRASCGSIDPRTLDVSRDLSNREFAAFEEFPSQ